MQTRSCNIASWSLLFLATANIIAAIVLWSYEPGKRVHTYEGLDYPEHWLLPSIPPVALVIEESVHYLIVGDDANEEWATTNSAGFGYLRLGRTHRVFALSMFHQLHCLRLMRSGLAGDHQRSTEGHFGHCLNYLRQMILCNPNLTLEPADILSRDSRTERVGAVHVCRDWRQVYNALETNWRSWDLVREDFLSNSTASATALDIV